MAIIDNGEIVLEAEPLRAIEELRGRIWRRIGPKGELPAVEREHKVIATKLLAGRTFVHVHPKSLPGPEVESVGAGLKDVYFTAMAATTAVYHGHRPSNGAVRDRALRDRLPPAPRVHLDLRAQCRSSCRCSPYSICHRPPSCRSIKLT